MLYGPKILAPVLIVIFTLVLDGGENSFADISRNTLLRFLITSGSLSLDFPFLMPRAKV